MTRWMSLLVAVATAANVSLVSAQTDRPAPPKGLSMSGIAKSVSQSSLTLDVDGNEITFVVDKTTRVVSKRATIASDLVLRTPDPKRSFTYYVKAGDPVAVVYRQVDGVLTLVQVRVLQKCSAC
jgi:Cu/Ag efflux protein CusF